MARFFRKSQTQRAPGTSTGGAWRQGPLWGVVVGCLTGLATILMTAHHPLGARLQYDTLDFWFRLRDPALPRDVAILAVDDETVQRWRGRDFDAPEIARLLRLLKNYRVRATALAFPDLATMPQNAGGQKSLARALKNTGIGHLPMRFRDPKSPFLMKGGGVHVFGVGAPGDVLNLSPALSEFRGLRLDRPGEALLSHAAGAGFLNFSLDPDGRVREIPLLLPHGARFYPSLPLSVLLGSGRGMARRAVRFTDFSRHLVPPEHAELLLVGPREIPARAGALLLNFPTGSDAPFDGDARHDQMATSPSPFHTISVAAALDNPRLLSPLKGKAVVVGLTASGHAPLFQGPGTRRLSAVEIYATALDNMLTGRALRRAPAWLIWVLTLVPCGLIGGFVSSRRPAWSGTITVTSLAALALMSLGLFSRNIWLDITAPWLGGALAYLIGVIGRARRHERESTRVASTIEAVSQVSEVIAAQTQTTELLTRVLDWAMHLLDSSSAAALLLDDNQTELHFVAAGGPKSNEVMPFTVKIGEGIAGWVAQTGRTAIVNDVAHDTRFKRDIDQETDFHTQSVLCVPLRVRDKILGVVEVLNRADGQPYTAADAELLLAVANQAAVVLENARLYEMLNLRVEESESALQRTNRRLETERNLFSTILQSMTGGVIVTDAEGMVQLVNPAARRLLPDLAGWDDQAPARQISQLVPDYFLAEPGANFPPAPSELRRGDPDAPRLIAAQAAPLHATSDAREAPAGWIVVLDDVTEARQMDRAKSDFVSFVAHEMRSPLTSIAGFASMLQRNENLGNTASRSRFLGIIHGESERLTRLINSLLDVARIEAGRPIELNLEKLDILDVAQAACEAQRAYSSRHNIVCAVPPGLPLLLADRDKLTQILINLIGNALKYAPGGNVTVSARRAGEFLEISVRDEGPGIAPEQRRILFERFGRTPSRQPVTGTGAQAKPTGTGLGLFLTKHLVETHGGTIRVGSGAGGGAVFTFTLPIAEIESEPPIVLPESL